jgi:phosphatidylserine synthase
MVFRGLCGPAMFVLACFGFPGRVLAAVLIAGLVSDLLDVRIARRLGTINPSLRHADTLVDAVFYTSAAAATAISVPGAFDGAGFLLILLITVQVSRATLELTKHRRLASCHIWPAQLLGLVLAVTMAWVLVAA